MRYKGRTLRSRRRLLGDGRRPQTGLDAATDNIYLCGDTSARLALAPELSRYAANVLPFIFPSAALRGGHDALKAPFPLILIPLCE